MKSRRFLKGCATLGGLLALGGFVCCLVGLAMGGSVRYLRFGPGGWGYDEPVAILDEGSDADSSEAPAAIAEGRGGHRHGYGAHGGHAEAAFGEASGDMVCYDLAALGGGSFSNLEVDLTLAELYLYPGDEFSLEISGGGPACRAWIEGGALHLRMEEDSLPINTDLSRLESKTLILTLPADGALDELDLEIGAGYLAASGLTCRKLEAEVGMGEMELTDLSCTEEAGLTAGMGEMTLTGFACAGKTEIEVNMGSLVLDGRLSGRTEIDCGMGSAELTLAHPGSYGYTAECGMGSIEIGGATVSAGTITGGSSGDTVYYDVECGMGSVTIEFA